MDVGKPDAIDIHVHVHVHAEVSCCDPEDPIFATRKGNAARVLGLE